MNEKEIIKIMNQKGYSLSSYKEFEKDKILTGSVNQVAATEHNLINFLGLAKHIGKFYLLKLSNGSQVRTWEVLQ